MVWSSPWRITQHKLLYRLNDPLQVPESGVSHLLRCTPLRTALAGQPLLGFAPTGHPFARAFDIHGGCIVRETAVPSYVTWRHLYTFPVSLDSRLMWDFEIQSPPALQTICASPTRHTYLTNRYSLSCIYTPDTSEKH